MKAIVVTHARFSHAHVVVSRGEETPPRNTCSGRPQDEVRRKRGSRLARGNAVAQGHPDGPAPLHVPRPREPRGEGNSSRGGRKRTPGNHGRGP